MYKQTLLLILTWLALLPSVLAQNQPTIIELTPAERAWLTTHPEIHLGIDKSWTPFVKLQENGNIVGIEPDLLARLKALTGANIQLTLGNWAEIVTQAERGELDGLAMSAAHPERAERFLFSTSHYSISRFIYAPSHTASTLRSMADLAGKRVGMTTGNLAEEKLLAKWPKIIPVPLKSGRDIAVALMNHDIDAAISGIFLLRIIRDELLPGLTIAFVVPESETKLLYSIRKEYPELLSIINKALAAIGPAETQEILEKWGAIYNAPTAELVLTNEEQAWLRDNPVVHVRIGDFPPYHFWDNGPRGISVELLDHIAKNAGFKIEYQYGTPLARSVAKHPQSCRH